MAKTNISTAEPLWSIAECAKFLSLTENAVRALVKRRRLEHLKISGRVRFVPQVVAEWAGRERRRREDEDPES